MFTATFVSLISIKFILVRIVQFQPILKVDAQNCGMANIFSKYINFKIYLNIFDYQYTTFKHLSKSSNNTLIEVWLKLWDFYILR